MTATASPLTSGVSAPPCTKAPAPASAPVRAWALLEEGVRLLEALPLEECSVSDVGENLRRMQQHVDRVQAESVGLLADFDRQGGPAAQRAPSAVAWLTRECRLNAPEANARLQLARCFDQLPAVTAAVRQGEIGFEHATVLARTATEVGAATVAPSPQLQAEAARLVERDLLDRARQVDPGRLRERARQFRNQVDSEGAHAAFLRAHARRRLSLAELPDGMVTVEGLLDPEGGALLRTALEQLMPPPRRGEVSNAVQRRADALVEVSRRVLDARPASTAAGRRPHLIVTVPVATLEGRKGAPGAQLGSTGAVVPAAVAQRLACDAMLAEVGVDEAGEAVDAAPARR